MKKLQLVIDKHNKQVKVYTRGNQLVKIDVVKMYKGGKHRPQILDKYYQNGHVVRFYMKPCGLVPHKTITLGF